MSLSFWNIEATIYGIEHSLGANLKPDSNPMISITTTFAFFPDQKTGA